MSPLQWHDIRDPKDPQLAELAQKYNLHPLHLEDCRNRNQSAKVEALNDYLFVVLKPVILNDENELETADLDFFIGPDWIITIEEQFCPASSNALDRLAANAKSFRPDEVFYRVMDSVVDSYQPIIDRVSDRIEQIEDRALADPQRNLLQDIFDLKRALMQLRRVLANTRDLVGHLLRTTSPVLKPELTPFFRDVYDHLMRNLDMVEIHRDLLNGATELYLSSVANRTNEVMKVMTILGTIATPALVITGLYGMNLKQLPFAQAEHAWGIVIAIIAVASVGMLLVLKRLRRL